ncbi:MAG: hypothetical protein A2677_00905 [Candidatus Komeilibacteria bacterium RIFCSPHIGHO2_01_FULL_52_14]|uniref:Adenylosuccinate synthetase n=1 Tax=Candidatus Komeilibacteria bacterium RIFCSPHIGHO2_01_FULL_52_14 TaxID=1798549 RepID=A0A1G2BJM6_9BACT|nr:MAG: hypothetical protein A2677_00905 [Candidatus Komeilibacteria bacterium RIFCSPHIGHO2_01_FULL_52_14]
MKTDFLNGRKTVAVIGGQFGDEGKGKIVDLLMAYWGDIDVRGTGGANAGHTACVDGTSYAFRLLPSGILHDRDGKINIIGPGVAFNPKVACKELDTLHTAGFSTHNLQISHRAHLVLPHHLLLDQVRELKRGSERIGTTLNGIGPTYECHFSRTGMTVNDLQNGKSFFRNKLERNLREMRDLFAQIDPAYLKKVLAGDKFENGRFYAGRSAVLDLDAITETYINYGERIAQYITDTDAFLAGVVGEENIVLEGAQATMLSVHYGTYPDVTSSDCTDQGLAQGAGIRERHIDLVLLVLKAFYMSRVGNGAFPTELGGRDSAVWCDHRTIIDEETRFPDASINDPDEFIRGVGIRRVGKEFGTVTKRLRRVGWFDLPLAHYAIRCAGPNVELVLTKLDVLEGCDQIKTCHAYEYRGPDHVYAGRQYRNGDVLPVAVPNSEILRHCTPLYSSFTGWVTPTSSMRSAADFPLGLRKPASFVQDQLQRTIRMISVGPDREQTIVV